MTFLSGTPVECTIHPKLWATNHTNAAEKLMKEEMPDDWEDPDDPDDMVQCSKSNFFFSKTKTQFSAKIEFL